MLLCTHKISFFRTSEKEFTSNIQNKKRHIVSLTDSKSKNKIKRGKRKSNKSKSSEFLYIIANNCSSIVNKKESLVNLIDKFHPGVLFLQETKCKRKNTIKLTNYTIFEHLRKESNGGGLLTAVHNNLNPVYINDGDDVEVLIVEIEVSGLKVRLMNGYGKQEYDKEEDRTSFFNFLDLEIKSAKLSGALVCLEMDSNSKVGPTELPNDPHSQTPNGKLLMELVENNGLIIVNSTSICEGLITRRRKALDRMEESAIDFYVVCPRFFNLITKMKIDEKRLFSLGSFQRDGSAKFVESDHNVMFLEVNLSLQWNLKEENHREEVYNYKNTDDFKKYVEVTEMDTSLIECFEREIGDINDQCNLWLSRFNSIIKKCFKRVRITPRSRNNKLKELFDKKESLKKEIETGKFDVVDVEDALKNLEELIEEMEETIADQNKRILLDNISSVENCDGRFNNTKGWRLKNKLAPNISDEAPVAKKDKIGTLITDKKQLEELYVNFYKERMAPNKISKGLEDLERHKENLYHLRLKIAEDVKSNDWTIEELNKVLKSLKNNKARDLYGHTYELFKNGGQGLKTSLLLMFNSIKNSKTYPEILSYSRITSIYKGKGSKNDLNSDRGIYNLVKTRSIMDKLIYNTNYEELDGNMSCSNIGARKGRNVRDHLLVVNSVLNEAIKDDTKIDAQVLDVKSCFDKLWGAETSNDVFESGLTNDQFVLSSKSNDECNVSIKMPWGKVSKNFKLNHIEMQGSVNSPLRCSITTDTLGKGILSNEN